MILILDKGRAFMLLLFEIKCEPTKRYHCRAFSDFERVYRKGGIKLILEKSLSVHQRV